MLYYSIDHSTLEVFLQQKKRMQLVGRLSRIANEKYQFIYDDKYMLHANSIAIGPGLPLSKKRHLSDSLFPDFLDRIPSSKNPAYAEYCQAVGISPNENDPMILLARLGKQGPTKFIIESAIIENKDRVLSNLLDFIQKTKLTHHECVALFDVPLATFSRLLNGRSTDKTLLRLIDLHLSDYKNLTQLFDFTRIRISEKKQNQIQQFLEQLRAREQKTNQRTTP
jgi:HipA-like protein